MSQESRVKSQEVKGLDEYRQAGQGFHEALSEGVLGSLWEGHLAAFRWEDERGFVKVEPVDEESPRARDSIELYDFVQRTAEVAGTQEHGINWSEVKLVSDLAFKALTEETARRKMDIAVEAIHGHNRNIGADVGLPKDIKVLNDDAVKAELKLRLVRNHVTTSYEQMQGDK